MILCLSNWAEKNWKSLNSLMCTQKIFGSSIFLRVWIFLELQFCFASVIVPTNPDQNEAKALGGAKSAKALDGGASCQMSWEPMACKNIKWFYNIKSKPHGTNQPLSSIVFQVAVTWDDLSINWYFVDATVGKSLPGDIFAILPGWDQKRLVCKIKWIFLI